MKPASPGLDEAARDRAYEQLTRRFQPIAEQLDDYGRADLDGILWALAANFKFGA